MANEIFKELKTKIALKQNTYEYWINGEGKDYIPLYGEVCFCEIPSPDAEKPNNGSSEATNPPTVLFKVGTAKKDENGDWVAGTAKKFSELKWVSALAADVYDWAKAATKPTYAAAEITGIGDYIAEYVNDQMGITTDTNTVYRIVKVDELTYKLQKKAANEADTAWADVEGSVIAIPESTKVEASEQNGYIKVDDEELQVFDDVFKAEGKTVVTAGGINAGSEVNGKTFQQILYNMMFPYQKPTISASASPNGGTYMKGNNQTITSVTATVTKKTEEIAKVELYYGSTLVATKNGEDPIASGSTSLVKNGGKVVFTQDDIIESQQDDHFKTISANGGQYKAKVYDITGGTAEASTGSFSFINPYYYGVCGASATLDEALIESLTKDLSGKATKTYNYTTNSQRMVIAYPKSYGVIKLVKDGNGLDNTGAFGSPVTVNITNEYGVAEDYYVYANGVTSGSAKMTFSY